MKDKITDVFRNLELPASLQDLMEAARVTRVAINRDNTIVCVFLTSPQWIAKEDILQVEQQIKQQLFRDVSMEIRIIEKFELSRQYTVENFYPMYRSSIMLELERYNKILYSMMHNAEVSFTDATHMKLKFPDSVVEKENAAELVRVLEKIFTQRCGLDCQLETAFVSRKKEDQAEQRALQNRVNRIAARARKLLQEQEGQEIAAPADTKKPAAAKPAAKQQPKTPAARSSETTPVRRPAQRPGPAPSGGRYRQLRRSDDPKVIYGRDPDETTVEIEAIMGEMGDVTVRGQVLTVESREIRNEKTILMFNVTDFTDTITVKMFLSNDQVPEITKSLKAGVFVRVKARTTIDRFDHELSLASVQGLRLIDSFLVPREDHAPVKRVELHCHTKMSDMDGVSDAKAIIQRAKSWGHPAIAITDHGLVQAFPEASHTYDSLADGKFKVIYGVEGYLVDDMKDIVHHARGQSLEDTYVVFDLETTGFSPVSDKIIEIGAVRVERGEITGRYSTFVNPQVPIPYRITELTSITDEMVLDAPSIETVLPEFLAFSAGATFVAHNADFDMSFISQNCQRLDLMQDFSYADTVAMSRFLLPGLTKFKLDHVAKALNVSLNHHHRAVDDAECTAMIFIKLMKMLAERDISDMNTLNERAKVSPEMVKKLPTYHVIILAKNDTGRINLYRLISESHLKYYARRPRIPKSVLQKYREGLLVGSACEAGELFRGLLAGLSSEEIARIVEFYDYLEIQPIGNNAFMLKQGREDIKTVEDLQNYNRKIVHLGEQFRKPVVGTCDVHFLDPEDEIYRRIIMKGKGFADADEQAPLYLRTTEEMLKEFAYLGSEKAEEIVVKNTNLIADLIDDLCPLRSGKFPPVIENSDETLREICYTRAHEVYGEKLPEIVEKRLERELHSIISNGYSVMYIIAQKLVWKSNEDGYLVGSRGSVGSSLAATMAGITEVNPLSPHYICEKCHYYDFDSPEVKAFSGRSGCDMPDKTCPVCGAPLKKEGFDIPFETFLGFKGDKEPDIDLNFSGEYQSKAHKYTEVIFGDGQTYRAGTIGTLAEKTAFGYVKNYFEEKNQHKRNCEIDRIVKGCVGIHRTTGQHPGGIIVLPYGEDINSFTPVQHPANDQTTDIITTHFDYHSIDSNLLKLDILGHDDPTMIRLLEDLTGLDAKKVPLDSKEVMSLFQNTKALGLTPEDIGGCPLGCLGVPEFGTDFAMQMLLDTQPKELSDLIRIAGLAHGTDVWLGNAQTLIKEGKCTISTAICTRDDIMIYLISKGMDNATSFTIMEAVRKGKGLKPDWEKDMRAHDVPEWYIWSCKKIKYMFPKAHAAAYVMMAWRIAWFKIFRPLAYYAAFFSIRATAFDYEKMCLGREKLEGYIAEYRAKSEMTAKEQDTLRDMRIVQEMYARGFDFAPIDLYKVQAHRFQIVDDRHIMPALDSISGLGEKVADAAVLAAMEGPFLSKDDFQTRTKISKTLIDTMDRLKILGDIPETNQFSLFDML